MPTIPLLAAPLIFLAQAGPQAHEPSRAALFAGDFAPHLAIIAATVGAAWLLRDNLAGRIIAVTDAAGAGAALGAGLGIGLGGIGDVEMPVGVVLFGGIGAVLGGIAGGLAGGYASGPPGLQRFAVAGIGGAIWLATVATALLVFNR